MGIRIECSQHASRGGGNIVTCAKIRRAAGAIAGTQRPLRGMLTPLPERREPVQRRAAGALCLLAGIERLIWNEPIRQIGLRRLKEGSEAIADGVRLKRKRAVAGPDHIAKFDNRIH